MKNQTAKIIGLAALLGTMASVVQADVVLFQDNFESGNLDQWVGKSGTPHHGQIVVDPLNSSNHVLTFTGVNSAGDIFSAARLGFSGPRRYLLSFDFLGLAPTGTTPSEYGGFIGISDSAAADPLQFWIAGTYLPALSAPSVATQLTADGQWHHYEIDITPLVITAQLTGAHLMLEDWNDRGSVPGDVYFDNVQLIGAVDQGVFDALVPCAGPAVNVTWKNHGQYVSTMSKVVEVYVLAGLITAEEGDGLVSAAAQSECGKSF
jgi:hypothetical protein